jgi:hypothetical protein
MQRRRWNPYSRNRGINWTKLESLSASPLTLAEVQSKRLELVKELLGLMLQDGEGLEEQRQTLQKLSATLWKVKRGRG